MRRLAGGNHLAPRSRAGRVVPAVVAVVVAVLAATVTPALAADLIAFSNPGAADPYTDLLVDPSIGDQQLYEDVRTGVDALVTVTDVTAMGPGVTQDLIVDRGDLDAVFTSNDFLNTLLPNTSSMTPSTKSVTVRIDFRDATSGAPVTLTDIAISAKDLDGDGGASGEYVQYSGITRYCLYDRDGDDVLEVGDNDIAVTTPGDAYRFAGIESQVGSAAKDGWAEVFYSSASSLVVTAGELLGNFARIAISFDDAGWSSDQACVDVARPTYTLTYDANGAACGSVPPATSGDGVLTVAGNTGALRQDAQVFDGWNSRADGTGQAFPAGSSYTPSSDLTLYAQYTAGSPDPCATAAAPGASPTLTCQPEVVPTGGEVTCTVSGGDADVDILWEVVRGEAVLSAGVRLDATGAGTFRFAAPAGAGDALAVRLVAWTGPVTVQVRDDVVTQPLPTRVAAGGGPVGRVPPPASTGLALLVGVLLVAGPLGAHRPGRTTGARPVRRRHTSWM